MAPIWRFLCRCSGARCGGGRWQEEGSAVWRWGSPGTWRLLHRRCPPPTTRPTPTCGVPTCEARRYVPPTTKPTRPHISPVVHQGGGWLSRVGRDRLGRCFLHAASYNVIITASIPRELPQHLESQLEWGEKGGGGNAMGHSTRTQRQLKKYNFVNSNYINVVPVL